MKIHSLTKVNTIKESYFSKTIKEEVQQDIAEDARPNG